MALSNEAFAKLTAQLAAQNQAPTTPSGGFGGLVRDAGQDIMQAGSGIANVTKRTLQKQTEAFSADQPLANKLTQAIGIGAGGASGILGEVVKGAVKTPLPQSGEDFLKKGIQKAASPIVQSKPVQDLISKYQSLDENTKRDVDSLLGVASFVADITGVGIGAKGAKVGSGLIKQGVEKTAITAQKAVSATKEAIKPTISPQKAVGEVLQGNIDSTTGAIEAIKKLDTTKVKTFKDLNDVINKKIPELSQKVDADLGQDSTKYSLDQLVLKKTSKSGQKVIESHVEKALTQLDELYATTGDAVSQTDIRELIEQATREGLTRKEVNDIARLYGQEFSSKAFSKMGDPLTSVNAQLFENTRKGLKDIARSGIKGADAKAADKLMSNLYNVQALVKKNAEAVNKLMQKIEDRGMLEKVGHGISKYADILSGGTIRGLIGGLLPRGAGYKTLNALDLEKLLERNLQIIREASSAKTTKQFNEIVKKLSVE